jgi:hypothetical protein
LPEPHQLVHLATSDAELSRAAAVLAEHTGIQTDTLAKLTWGIRHNDLPDWATKIDRRTLMIIDEAGMADTVSLDIAIQYAIDRAALRPRPLNRTTTGLDYLTELSS